MAQKDHDQIRSDFEASVNMTATELDRWLDTEQSQSVGDSHIAGGDGGESTGHKMGKRIVSIQKTTQDALTDDDYAAKNKVVGYIHRHLAQRPSGDLTDTHWRYSLMNWGHDPLKEP